MPRVLFLGSKRVGLRCLQVIHDQDGANVIGAVTPDDSSDVRTVRGDIEAEARRRGIPLEVVRDRDSVAALIRTHAPDLCLVVGWYWLLNEQVLREVPRGFHGIHFSLLPKYRGSSPLIWAMINEEPETGVSLFALSPGMDDGDLWGQLRVPIRKDEYVGSVLARLEDAAVELLRANYAGILAGTAHPVAQAHEFASYCAVRRPSDGLIDWSLPAHRVLALVRAQSRPYPGAFSYLGEQKVTIWRASDAGATWYGVPGQVVQAAGNGAVVVCGDDRAIVVEEVEADRRTGTPTKVLRLAGARLTAPTGAA